MDAARGLEVAALDGRPGVLSARYGGANLPHAEKIQRLLQELNGRPSQARFVCVAALVWPDGKQVLETGVCEGEIVSPPRGEGGFGYDPIFYLPDQAMTMAELPAEVKNRISHRARAFLGLAKKVLR